MNTLEKVKWGFIGCGEVTEKKSGPAFSMIRNSEVVAVMSRKAEKAESYARRNNIPRWYTDAQLLIGDEDVNAVYIATPPSSHATFAIMAMKAGKPVSSLLPPHTIPLGCPSAPAPSIQYPASNLDWRFVSYMMKFSVWVVSHFVFLKL